MKGQSEFERAMNQIAAQNSAELEREAAQAARQRLMTKVRAGVMTILWVAFFGTAFYYHSEIQVFAKEKFFSHSKTGVLADIAEGNTNSATANSLKVLQEHASRRDGILAETAK